MLKAQHVHHFAMSEIMAECTTTMATLSLGKVECAELEFEVRGYIYLQSALYSSNSSHAA